MRAWARRTAELHGELAAIAEVDPRWWLLAGGAAAAEASRRARRLRDLRRRAERRHVPRPRRAARRRDPIADAIARAHAARTALRELDGELPDQPLAVTLRRDGATVLDPSALDVAAFAIGDRCLVARARRSDARRPARRGPAGATPLPWRGAAPFVCVSLGDDPLETARHAPSPRLDRVGGPWLGLGRAGDLATVSTCHLVVDGYGHARHRRPDRGARRAGRARPRHAPAPGPALPPLAPVAGAIPLGVAWRELPIPAPARAPARLRARRDPPPPGRPARRAVLADVPDPGRARAVQTIRCAAAAASCPRPRSACGSRTGCPSRTPVFEARARALLLREAEGSGLCSRLLAAARAAPAPLAWKRRGFSAGRPRWLDRLAEVIGGRACLSRILVDAPLAPTCAVSSPARLAAAADPLGACVVTVIDDGAHAAITACGSGLAGSSAAAAELIEELLAGL